jgi:hypothetical protein
MTDWIELTTTPPPQFLLMALPAEVQVVEGQLKCLNLT